MLPSIKKTERRGKGRTELQIKSLEDARRFVQIVGTRNVENDSRAKAWRIAKQALWLLLLVLAYLVYFLLDLLYKDMSLP